jgi:benzoate-CoA ligase
MQSATLSRYNAAEDFLSGGLRAAGAESIVYIDADGAHTRRELADAAQRFSALTVGMGLPMESRILLCLEDSFDFPVTFLGAIHAGVIPVPINTLLTPDDFRFIAADSRAQALVVSAANWPAFAGWIDDAPCIRHVVICGGQVPGRPSLAGLLAGERPRRTPAPTTEDDACFWLYTSGSTGPAKAAVHVHRSLSLTAESFARGVLGMNGSDVVFSASKLCFAFGLGNSLSFPLATGATAVLLSERPSADSVARILRRHRPTLFFAVPTLYNALLACEELPPAEELSLRLCVSSGEPLPAELGRRIERRLGAPVLDAIGSTEMLHSFLSNRPDDVRYGTTGRPVPGYELRIVDDNGEALGPGNAGELQVRGPTAASHYWNRRERTRATFLGEWTRTGDRFFLSDDGYYSCCGRCDDMLKVSGNYVSPFEVECALGLHPAIREAAVVGHGDASGLVKPRAFVVLKPGVHGSSRLAAELQTHVKSVLAPWKYPRWIEFLPELPRTPTGKIQRYRLRDLPLEQRRAANS